MYVCMRTYMCVSACMFGFLLILTVRDCKCHSALTAGPFFVKVRMNKKCDAGKQTKKIINVTPTSRISVLL